jgi:hypothetical protein
MNSNSVRIALTHGKGGENNAGMQIEGEKPIPNTGFTNKDLEILKTHYDEKNISTELIPIKHEDFKHYVLVLRNIVDKTDEMFKEWTSFTWDDWLYDPKKNKRDSNGKPVLDKYNNPVKGRVMKKHARSNCVGREGISKKPVPDIGQGTVVNTDTMPIYSKWKKDFMSDMQSALTSAGSAKKIGTYITEGNLYHDPKKTYIGWHGDRERVEVVCLSLGFKQGGYPLRFCVFQNSKPISEVTEILLNDGDVYIMSEGAVGREWLKKKIKTIRHSAGFHKNASELPKPRKKRKRVVECKNMKCAKSK